MGVPTYAPASFAHAEQLLRCIRQERSDRRAEGRLEDDIAAAQSALDQSTEIAIAAEPHLSELVRTRAQALRSQLIGYYAAEHLHIAEQRFSDAVRHAERRDFSAADELVLAAERSFLEATVASLEKALLQRLANEIARLEDVATPGTLNDAKHVLEQLRDAASAARNQQISLPMLRERMTVGTASIRRAVNGRTGGIFDGELDPPMAPDPGWAPGTFEPPEAPRTMRITARTSAALRVDWKKPEGVITLTQLERSVADGPFEVVAEYDAADEAAADAEDDAVPGWRHFEDIGLSSDTLHCYRVRVQNDFGSSVTTHDNMAVGYTTTDALPVWRVQLHIRVADVPDAGTSDSIAVRLQSPLLSHAPHGNSTWLDHAPRLSSGAPITWSDDFDRGSEFCYDLTLAYMRQLGDISMITLRKEGSDAVGVAEFALFVNGKEVFRKYFGDTASTCLWLNDGDGHSPMFTVFHPELRASPKWQSFVQHPPAVQTTFLNDEIVSRFEATVGDAIHGTPAEWRTSLSPVRVTRKLVAGKPGLHLRLQLTGEAPSVLPDPNLSLGIDFGVIVTCNASNTEATLSVTSEEFHASADFDLVVKLLLLALAPAGIALLALGKILAVAAVESSWQQIVQQIIVETPGFCPTVEITEDDDGDAGLRFH